jgi:hypothetical protein
MMGGGGGMTASKLLWNNFGLQLWPRSCYPIHVEKALQRLTHPVPTRPQGSPHLCITPTYGANIQYVEGTSGVPFEPRRHYPHTTNHRGTFLFCGRAVDNSMLTRMNTDNSTADGFANQHTKIKLSKAMDMRIYLVEDHIKDGQFQVHWLQTTRWACKLLLHQAPSTKHQPPSHHIKMRTIYLHLKHSHTGHHICWL